MRKFIGFLILVFFLRSLFVLNGDELIMFRGEQILRGCIVDEEDVRADKIKYIVKVSEIFINDSWKNISGKTLVNGGRYPVYEYGDCLEIEGILKNPMSVGDFDYGDYLARYEVYTVINAKNILKIGESGNFLREQLFDLKNYFESKLNSVFGEPQGSLMAGLLLGSKRGISEELLDKFSKTGLTHILVVSGFNITLVIFAVERMFLFLSRKLRIFFSVFFVILFVIFVGASAAVVRAGIMGIISLMALYFGRLYHAKIALFVSAYLMILWNPKILFFDVGFQLSVLATAGLLYISPLIERYFLFLPKFLGIRETIVMCFSAQLFVLPIIVLNFGQVSLISPLANLLVLPLVPITMLIGFLVLFVGIFSDFLMSICAFFADILMRIMVYFIEFFAGFKFAAVEVGWFYIFVFYFGVLFLLIRDHKKI